MTTKSVTYYYGLQSAQSFGPVPHLLNGGVQCDVWGALGGTCNTSNRGAGGRVTGTVPMSPTDTLAIYAGENGTFNAPGWGYHDGGQGGSASSTIGKGGGGAGSSAVVKGSTKMIEAGGGAGSGGDGFPDGVNPWGGAYAGAGGAAPQAGGDGSSFGLLIGGGGGGAPAPGVPGAGGASVTNAGAAGSTHGGNGASSVGGINNDAAGGGGGGGDQCGGGGGAGGYSGSLSAPGGGGAGGLSYANAAVGNPIFYDGVSTVGGYVVVTYTYADPPLAPTLGSPNQGAYVNLAAGSTTFQFTPNYGTDSGAINAFALRLKLAGGSYHYWNGTDFTSTTPVWNPIIPGINAVTIANALIGTNGNSYQWSVATQESHYNLQGPFASDHSFSAVVSPMVAILSPPNPVFSPNPTVSWNGTFSGGESQLTYRVCVYTQSQAGAPGFVPGVGAAFYDTGTVTSTATSIAIPTALTNTDIYVIYVQLTQTPGSAPSPWASVTTQVEFDGPAAPVLAAIAGTDPNTGCPITTLTAQDSENMLAAIDSSFEAGLGDWTGVNATLSVTGMFAEDQKNCMKMVVTAINGSAVVPGDIIQPVVGGASYSFMASLMSPFFSGSATLEVNWFDGGGSFISTSVIATQNVTSSWQQYVGSAIAPSTAMGAYIIITSPTNGAVILVDEVGMFLGTGITAWTIGGYEGNTIIEYQYSDDQIGTEPAGAYGAGLYGAGLYGEIPVVPTAEWFDLRYGTVANQNAPGSAIIDYESPFNQPRFYRARSVGTTLGQQVYSAWSNVVSTELDCDQYWYVDPVNPGPDDNGFPGAIPVYRTSSRSGSTASGVRLSHEIQQIEQQGQFQTFGNPNTVLVRGDMYAENFDMATWFGSLVDWENFDQLRLRRVTLCMRSDLPGKVHYMAIGSARPRDLYSGVSRNKPDSMSEVIITCIPQDVP